jgi:hypothetical protein
LLALAELLRKLVREAPSLRSANLFAQLAREEVADDRRNFRAQAFEGEVTGVEEVNFRVRVVPPEGLGARRQKERIVLSPDCESRGTMSADVFLESGVERDIAVVVTKQIELDLVVARSSEQRKV